MIDDKKAFGIAVRQRLIELDISQRELAQMVGAKEEYIWHITHGRRTGAKYRNKIKSVLNLSYVPEQLIEKAI